MRLAPHALARDDASTLTDTADELAGVVEDPAAGWAWPLLLELLAHAARDAQFRKLASRFWSGTRSLSADVIRREYERNDREPPTDPRSIASALIALDIGLAVQHMVDPDEVPLSLYPELFELLFGPLRAE